MEAMNVQVKDLPGEYKIWRPRTYRQNIYLANIKYGGQERTGEIFTWQIQNMQAKNVQVKDLHGRYKIWRPITYRWTIYLADT